MVPQPREQFSPPHLLFFTHSTKETIWEFINSTCASPRSAFHSTLLWCRLPFPFRYVSGCYVYPPLSCVALDACGGCRGILPTATSLGSCASPSTPVFGRSWVLSLWLMQIYLLAFECPVCPSPSTGRPCIQQQVPVLTRWKPEEEVWISYFSAVNSM